jgi:hypothetical protein
MIIEDPSNFNKEENKVDVSIIIVNYKSWSDLQNCLNSLNKIHQKTFSFETIVIDNCSNDGKLIDFSKKHENVLFFENSGNNGFSNGCNTGANKSSGEYLLFLNPDTIVSTEALEKMFITLKENSNYGIVSCSQTNTNGRLEDSIRIFPQMFTLFGLSRAIFRLVNDRYKTIVTSEEKKIFPDWVSGSTIFISKLWFNKIGKWNEDYWMYFEDVDLCKKVTDLGGKVCLLKDVSIIHNHGGASRINVITTALTKSQVLISRHIYVNTHFSGISKNISQILLVSQNVFSKLILGFLGSIFFFLPKLNIQYHLLINMKNYYFQALKNKSWLSFRSTQFLK